MSRTAVNITLNTCEQELLQKIHRKRSVAEYQKERIQTFSLPPPACKTKTSPPITVSNDIVSANGENAGQHNMNSGNKAMPCCVLR